MNYEGLDQPDHKDLEMVVQQLNTAAASIGGLMEHLEMKPDCPHITEAWVQSKVTLASAYLDSVHDYVIHAHGAKDPLKKEGSKVYSDKPEDKGQEEYDDDDYEDDGKPVGFMVAIERNISKR